MGQMIGDKKDFPNGRSATWDGIGWEAQPQAVAPPPAPVAPAVDPQQAKYNALVEQDMSSGFSPVGAAPRHEDPSMLAPGLGGLLGAVVGGKAAPTSPGNWRAKAASAGLAGGGVAFGDLYNTLSSSEGRAGLMDVARHPFNTAAHLFDDAPVEAMQDEAAKLATVVGATGALETAGPALLGLPKRVMNHLPWWGAGHMAIAGHPAPLTIKATGEGMDAVGKGLKWAGTPYEPPLDPTGGTAQPIRPTTPPPGPGGQGGGMPTPEQVQANKSAGGVPAYLALGKGGPTPPPAPPLNVGAPAPTQPAGGPLDALRGIARFPGALKDSFSQGLTEGMTPPRPPVRYPQSTEVPFYRDTTSGPVHPIDLAEAGGPSRPPTPASRIMPSAANSPTMRNNAEVSTPPLRERDLTQTAPTDPNMAWEELASRQHPLRTTTGGNDYSIETSGAPSLPRNRFDMSSTPKAALSGLKTTDPPTGSTLEEPPSTAYDRALGRERMRSISKVGGDQDFPQTVDEAEGMSLGELDAWEGAKRTTPGLTDANVNPWYRANKLGGNPGANLDIQGNIQALLKILGVK